MLVKTKPTKITNKNGDQYLLTNNLTTNFLQQLVDFAHTDQQVMTQTSDPSRFTSLTTAQTWLKKTQKKFYLLSPTTEPTSLAGVVWFEMLPLPTQFQEKFQVDWTFGIRVYEKHRHRGLAIPLMEKAFSDFLPNLTNKKVWLSTKTTNSTASSLYEKFGFKKIGELNNKAYYIFSGLLK